MGMVTKANKILPHNKEIAKEIHQFGGKPSQLLETITEHQVRRIKVWRTHGIVRINILTTGMVIMSLAT